MDDSPVARFPRTVVSARFGVGANLGVTRLATVVGLLFVMTGHAPIHVHQHTRAAHGGSQNLLMAVQAVEILMFVVGPNHIPRIGQQCAPT